MLKQLMAIIMVPVCDIKTILRDTLTIIPIPGLGLILDIFGMCKHTIGIFHMATTYVVYDVLDTFDMIVGHMLDV